jgi:D-alanyl-D-alanine carboxypeptidase
MIRNAWAFGFVLSYPRGKSSQVCYGYEPWHYRYYGRALAGAIRASGLPPRVGLWQHQTVEPPAPPSPRGSRAIRVNPIPWSTSAP